MVRAKNEITTMSVTRPNLRRLEALGKKSETYDDVLKRILDKLEEVENAKV